MLEIDSAKSLVIISFRGSSRDKELMTLLAEKLNCKPSTIVRIGLRVLNEVIICSVLSEAMYRVHVNKVLHEGMEAKNVLRTSESVIQDKE